MPNYVIEVPKTYSARVGGNGLQPISVTVTASSAKNAKTLLAKRGVPSITMSTPLEVGDTNSGQLFQNINEIAFDPTRRSLYNANTGGSNPISSSAGGASASAINYRATQPRYGTEEGGGGNNFAPNVNPAPTSEQVQNALPFKIGGVDDPFKQPAAYQRLTPEYFASLRKGATAAAAPTPTARSLYDDGSDLSVNETNRGVGDFYTASDIANIVGSQTNTLPGFDAFKSAPAGADAAKARAAAKAAEDAAAAKAAEDALVASRSFTGKLAAIKSGEISLYSGGTFDLAPFEDPEFWDAIFQQLDGEFSGTQEGDSRSIMLDLAAKQIAAASGGNEFESKKAVKEFYKQAEVQMNSRGFGDLSLSDGGTLNTFAFAQQKTKKVEEVASTSQGEADADLATSEFDLGTGGGAIGGEGEGFFSDSKTSDLVGNMTAFQPDPKPAQAPQPQPEGTTSSSGMVNIQDIIDTFEQINRMPPTSQVPVIDEFTGLPKREADIQVAGTPASVGFPATDPYTIPGEIVYETVVNPLLARLLDDAEFNNGMVSEEAIYAAQNETQVEIAELRKEEALGVAYQNGVSAEEIARIQREGDSEIALARQLTDKYLADQQLVGTQAQASATEAAAESARLGVEAASKDARIADQFVASSALAGQRAAAAADSPFGFINQGGSTADLASIYAQLNEVGLAQAGAASLGAQDNAFSFAANQKNFDPNQIAQIAANSTEAVVARGQAEAAQIQGAAQQAIAQIQSNVGLDQNNKEYQIAQIVDQTQRAVAAITGGSQQYVAQTQAGAQLSAAQAAAGAASPYGFMQQGGTSNQLEQIFAGQNAVGMAQANPYGQTAADRQLLQETQFNPYQLTNAQGYGLGQVQAANNPYAATQLGQDSTRVDQILRGGLSAEQRLAEINASQSGQNFANQLNFMSNPSAVGFATEQGLFGSGNNQILQDINNSPEGNLPGSLFGFNSPSPAGAGGNATTNTGNFNANTLRNASDEQIGFLQGAASAGGQTPSEFRQEVESFTPQGVGY
jgi:hypothetical protein